MTFPFERRPKAPKKVASKIRERQVYRETYRRQETSITHPARLPVLKDIPANFTVIEMQTLAAGVVERGLERLEYQDIRIYLRAK